MLAFIEDMPEVVSCRHFMLSVIIIALQIAWKNNRLPSVEAFLLFAGLGVCSSLGTGLFLGLAI